jgi:hypothetical protein
VSSDYWLGVATLPTIIVVLLGLLVTRARLADALERRGVTFEAKVRDTSKIDEYTLRNNIWWERSFGPVFVGGWYREPPQYRATPKERLITRWVGLGSANGPCLMVLRKRDLGPVDG